MLIEYLPARHFAGHQEGTQGQRFCPQGTDKQWGRRKWKGTEKHKCGEAVQCFQNKEPGNELQGERLPLVCEALHCTLENFFFFIDVFKHTKVERIV